MKSNILGYPRIGAKRELKKACESYWKKEITKEELLKVGAEVRKSAWELMKKAGVDYIPSNDFSFYDSTLDTSLTYGAIPERYKDLLKNDLNDNIDLYFAMARGMQTSSKDVIAMEMTKWFDTNYHYIVPEFTKDQKFKLTSLKAVNEFNEAKKLGIITKPVLLSPASYLLLGKCKETNPINLLNKLMPVFLELVGKLKDAGAKEIQIDEPFLVKDIDEDTKDSITQVFVELKEAFPELKIFLTTYFEGLKDNIALAVSLPIDVLHIDLVRDPSQLNDVVEALDLNDIILSMGVVEGRNIWKNDMKKSLEIINSAKLKLGIDRVMVGTSCSLLHSPFDLDLEKDEKSLPKEVKRWMSYAKQKVEEVVILSKLASGKSTPEQKAKFEQNKLDIEDRKTSKLIHKPIVKERVNKITEDFASRKSPFKERQKKQLEALKLPLYPTTTIGSFPQTTEVRNLRLQLKKKEITEQQYNESIKKAIIDCIKKQEEIDIDVLVHGEFERNDMVEYFGERLDGFAFSQNGWVQSYGSRGVKPPIIYGDVERKGPMTVEWSKFSQSQTKKIMKGMLTGPVTILQWSFVRDDQPRKYTTFQLALAIRDEVVDLEKAGIKIIQIDEPAFREGLPIRKENQEEYLKWSVKAFRISASGVNDETQIHTHMCYCDFNDVIDRIAEMDADAITIETSRSQMELLDAFKNFKYPNEIGPGVYDIHSPRIPTKEEMVNLIKKAKNFIPERNLWVNPDCGLKTRGWKETMAALKNMVDAAKELRKATK